LTYDHCERPPPNPPVLEEVQLVTTHRRVEQGLPVWLHITVIIGALSIFGYSVVRFGPAGYAIDMIAGGLVGAYAGVNKLVIQRQADDNNAGTPPPPSSPPGGPT
jgi:hypothetical protein